MEHQEIERNFQEIWKLFAETDRQIQETDKKVNALTSKWSKFVEALVVPAAARLFRERGILVDKVSQRVRARENGEGMEIDVLAVER
jgi:hypothetical protein